MNKSSLKRGNEIEKEITELQNEIEKLSRYNKISKRLNIINRSVRLNIDLSCYSNKFISDLILTEEDVDILIYARQQRIKKLEKEFEELK